jgi:type VI secretion system secreted protein VgrG
MIADQNAAAPGLTRSLQIYDYPGRYKAVDVGQNFTRWQIESLRADASCGEGQGRCQYLTAGGRFTLAGHPDASLDRRYLLVEVLHEGRQPQALEEAAGDGGMFLATSFAVIDGMTPWRPSRRMRPIADGPEIARVVGPTGEEIYTDPYSRIKVQFPWDRYGQFDDRSSCWIRVAQAWGGPTYGNIAIPRIGHEVIVSFLNGDPDQPIVTGRAYHATNLPPYACSH